MSSLPSRARRSAPVLLALSLMLACFSIARLPEASAQNLEEISAAYSFERMSIAMPPGYRPEATVRQVNPSYQHLRSWISSVGAGVAMTDLDANGRADELCVVDPRTDQVVISYAPTGAARFTPFVLDPDPLPTDAGMAPMGCTPGDYNLDGRMDLLVTYWGRTPVLFLARTGAEELSARTYRPVELVANISPDGAYHGPRWNTNAVAVEDFAGQGHPDILIANYFPDSDVLDPQGQPNVVMNSSMSNAKNGGGAHLLRWVAGEAGGDPAATYVEEPDAIPAELATGWSLAAAGADLTGDGLAELYIANDFGKDHLLYNRSSPGRIRFSEAIGSRGATTAKSFVLGRSSFKGMGVDFGDLNGDGRPDLVVSNITTAWGLEESNFAWLNQTSDDTRMAEDLEAGSAPFEQRAQEMGLAWTGWGWDVKLADFTNSGRSEVVQAEGFVRGQINRWPWLQEMAMTNDQVFSNPMMWPDLEPGDDLAGHQPFAFYALDDDGVYQDVAAQLGMTDVDTPSRGIATGDSTGSGRIDFAVARQWDEPSFYANRSPDLGRSLDLRLFQPVVTGSDEVAGTENPGAPAYGASVQVTLPSGQTTNARLDGGGGHSGKRDLGVHIGLGEAVAASDAISVRVSWRSSDGTEHQQSLDLTPGRHDLILDSTAQEVGH